ncbi:putative fatty acyl-CoA reductase CG5065 [Musca vetustissima]|uniref:putative fatty acyl-CoA reductase CG5065 n=1 Tax=Musca vetustissima TaxID=27455 RepID=UPI002AB70EDB|nr:putative fatty acyl-CoA reductase CG5065 [Musca vetustissima]
MSIENFYRNQEIFITGGSGFIGKALIEKLLRSLPNFGKMYVLIRSKKGKSAAERLEETLNSTLFRRAREEQPDAFKRIIPIEGDCNELGLGISAENLQKLQNVNLIFHVAACVRFDDTLKNSIFLNTRSTYELVKIAERMKNLKAFIHVSTTYAHPDRITIEEMVYPPYADWRTTIKLAETYDDEILDTLFPKYAESHPNTYTFTKSLAEQIIREYRTKLPVAIFRPSIVISSIEEPFPGWVDNFNGPIGMLVACGVGIMRTNNGNPDCIPDFIPVDFCVRTLLLTAYKVVTQPTPSDQIAGDVEVFHCSNSKMNSISTGELIEMGKKVILENPFEKCIWVPQGNITRCDVWHYTRVFCVQILPALLFDFLLRFTKYPPFLMKLQRRIHCTKNSLELFINTEWNFINTRLMALEDLVEDKDKKRFGFLHYVEADKEVFLANGIKGAKEFLLKERPVASPQARLRLRIYMILHNILKYVGLYYLLRYIYRVLCVYFNVQ